MNTDEPVGVANGTEHQRATALGTGSTEELRSAAEDLASSAEQLYRVGDAFLAKHAEDKPYVILGAAAGVGFVLGGGLASRLAGTFLNALGRMAITHAVDAWVTSQVSAQSTLGDAE
jgi:hypothetical protein